MSGRHPFSELTKDFTSERRRHIDEMKGELKSSMAVFMKLIDVFPELYVEKKRDHTFAFEACGYKGATIYLRKSHAGLNQARIHSGRLNNCPNPDNLKSYFEKNQVPVDRSESHPDFLVGPDHVDAVITILKEGLSQPSTAETYGKRRNALLEPASP